jgi:hypothetical protein
MANFIPRSITWSRIVLFALTILYSSSSLALIIPTFGAVVKAAVWGRNEECTDVLECTARPLLFAAIGVATLTVSLLTGITAANVLRSPERKRLRASDEGVSRESIGLYVFRVVIFTLFLYGLLVWIGWTGGLGLPSGLFMLDLLSEEKSWNFSKAATFMLHSTA